MVHCQQKNTFCAHNIDMDMKIKNQTKILLERKINKKNCVRMKKRLLYFLLYIEHGCIEM